MFDMDAIMKTDMANKNKKQDRSLLSEIEWNHETLSVMGALIIVFLHLSAKFSEGFDAIGPFFLAITLAPIFTVVVVAWLFTELISKQASSGRAPARGAKSRNHRLPFRKIIFISSLLVLIAATLHSIVFWVTADGM
jgi:hypothetical protein